MYKFDSRGMDKFEKISWDDAFAYIGKGLKAIATRYSGEPGAKLLAEQGYPPQMIKMMEGAGTRTLKFRGGMGLLGVLGKYGMYRLGNSMALLEHKGQRRVYLQRLLDSCTTTARYKLDDIMAGKYGPPGRRTDTILSTISSTSRRSRCLFIRSSAPSRMATTSSRAGCRPRISSRCSVPPSMPPSNATLFPIASCSPSFIGKDQRICFRYEIKEGPKVFEREIRGKKLAIYDDTIIGYSKDGTKIIETKVEEPFHIRPDKHANSI